MALHVGFKQILFLFICAYQLNLSFLIARAE
jgi:hypothetical protein